MKKFVSHNLAAVLRSILLSAFLLGLASAGWGQTTQNFYWTFNESSTNCAENVMTQTPLSTGITGSFDYTDICSTTGGTATTGFPFVAVAQGANALRNYVPANSTKYWYFTVNVTGTLSDIQVYLQIRRSISGATYNSSSIQYSLDGGNTYIGAQELVYPSANVWQDVIYDFPSLSVVNSYIIFRINWDQAGSATNADIDNFQMQGTYTPPPSPGSEITQTFYTSDTFTVPNCVTSFTVEAWGGGGGGGGVSRFTNYATRGGGGGGGGAYKINTLSVEPGQTYSVNIGTGGIGNYRNNGSNGNATTVTGVGGSVTADYGRGGIAGTGGSNGTGGEVGTGDNNGGFGGNSSGNGAGGGGGAGSGSSGTNGGNTTSGTGGTGTFPGGNGGDFRSSNGDGNNANLPGGGGGGGRSGWYSGATGGAGGNGQVIITYTLPDNPTIVLVNTNAAVCYSEAAQNVSFAFTGTTGCPNIYSIAFDAAAINAGFTNIINQNLGASPFTIAVPANAPAATYNATLTLTNTAYDFTSIGYGITVTVNSLPTFEVAQTNISCYGASDGSIAINAISGSAPFSYSLNDGAWQSLNTFSGLPAATHTIKVKDNNGCIQTDCN